MFEIFYVWGYESRGAFINDPIEFDARTEELSDLAFYSSMAADLAREAAAVDELVAWDAARILGEAPPSARSR